MKTRLGKVTNHCLEGRNCVKVQQQMITKNMIVKIYQNETSSNYLKCRYKYKLELKNDHKFQESDHK